MEDHKSNQNKNLIDSSAFQIFENIKLCIDLFTQQQQDQADCAQ